MAKTDENTLNDMFQHLKKEIEEIKQVLIQKSDKILTEKQVCETLDVGAKTLRSYRANGWLGYSKIGNKIIYRQSDLDRLLSNARYDV